MARHIPSSGAIAVVVPAIVLALGATAGAQVDDEGRLWAFREEVVERLDWRAGERIEIMLPVQPTTYRWDLVASRSEGVTKLGRFFDDSTPPRFSFDVRKMTPEEQERYNPRPGGVLGRVDQVQIIPVRLDDPEEVVLTFRQYDTLQDGPPGRQFIELTLRRR
ncbi:hypothetical protein [Tautonia plasticadhaerens]|uniref:Uncharacterized protein n=1 Tax=Tautonia plasticadhaerens TaxID=2527974 RepID=A0A518H1N5_9BACT|nr:hypothetical protein [Tautonia plasticadhaerens]QDV34731.1 hypothetical protein ElP_26250 [Tautonia plasticadhaerens]